MPKKYRATVNLDYSSNSNNEYQYLVSALIQSGWKYVETSALTLETEDRNQIWSGIALVAKQDGSIPELSAITIHIQASENFEEGINYEYEKTHSNALESIKEKPYPTEFA